MSDPVVLGEILPEVVAELEAAWAAAVATIPAHDAAFRAAHPDIAAFGDSK